ncbi:MAG TPA: DUF4118 domain-containing protein [Pirellulales bacterium]|jgi:PAS domain S-box-containing protein|nr:DUF4118 domain-containing protein [Pirellulales bacterium]
MNVLPFSPIPLDHETFVPEGPSHVLRRYLWAAIAVAVAFFSRWIMWETLSDTAPYALFIPAVLLVSVYGGFAPGLLSLVASGVLGLYFFQRPYYTFNLTDVPTLQRLVLFTLAGLSICVVGGLLDTARRRARDDARELRRQTAQFRASDENYRRMFETAYEGICCLDETEHINYVNGRMVDMLGCSIIGMVGHPVTDFAFEEDRPRLKEMFARRRQGGREVFDFRLRRKDGSAVYCIISTQSIFDRAQRYHGLLNMITDVTTRSWSADDVNRLFDRLKAQVQSLQSMQQAAFAQLDEPAEPVLDGDALAEARRAVARSIELSDQIAVLLRTGKTNEIVPSGASPLVGNG